MSELTKAAFARSLDVSPPYVSKAIREGRVCVRDGLIDTEHPVNQAFAAVTAANAATRAARRKEPVVSVARQFRTGRVEPGWMALAIQTDGKRVPLLFVPPAPGAAPILVVEEPESWGLDLETSRARGPDGSVYELIAIFDGEFPPLELREGQRAAQRANKKTGGSQ